MTVNPFDLTGNTVIVTGGAGLVGESVCSAIDRRGGNVIVADIDDERGTELAERLPHGEFFPLDVADPTSIEALCDFVVSDYGRIDGLVNAAYPRTESYGQPFESVGIADWQENVNLHLGGYYGTTREVALRMVEGAHSGSIVNFGSIYGVQAPDFTVYERTDMTSPVEYAAIKGAIVNLSRYLASYLGPEGIRVNVVSPGGIFDEQNEQFVESYEQRVPLGRMAKPEDVTGAVVYLLSDASSYVTGHNLVIDGGWTIK